MYTRAELDGACGNILASMGAKGLWTPNEEILPLAIRLLNERTKYGDEGYVRVLVECPAIMSISTAFDIREIIELYDCTGNVYVTRDGVCADHYPEDMVENLYEDLSEFCEDLPIRIMIQRGSGEPVEIERQY